MLPHSEYLFRIFLGALLSALIGLERDRHRRQAGLRTHLIVGMASATFTVISAHFMFYQNYTFQGHGIDADPSRIAASVVSGIGFLGAGSILRTGISVQGLTTAAGLWLVTAIGMCEGAGMYWEGLFVTVLGLFSLGYLRRFESKDSKPVRRQMTLHLLDQPDIISELIQLITKSNITVADFEYEKYVEERKIVVSFDLRITPDISVSDFVQRLENHPSVRHISIQTPR